jgi:hypothetical protein
MTPTRSRLAPVATLIPVLILAGCQSRSIIGEHLGDQPDAGSSTGGTTATGGRTATGGTTGSGGVSGTGGSIAGGPTPCGVLAAGSNPCVAAHSTVRVIYPGYAGPLYRVCKGTAVAGPDSCTSGVTMDIGSINGYADAAAQQAFCAGATCTISVIYDQTPNGNNLMPAPAGGAKATPDTPANAAGLPVTINGHAVYGLAIQSGNGYRAGCGGCGVPVSKGMPVGDQPETIYMVTSQNGLVNGCCFDYGNAETDAHDDGNGTAESINFGNGVVWGTGAGGDRSKGPWVMADLENGLFAGWQNNQDQAISTNLPLPHDFVSAVLVGDSWTASPPNGRFALYGGDATTGVLQTMYDGTRPTTRGYAPMSKQGSIVLGIAGDNSAADSGEFFEGAIATGAATSATLVALQASIAAAGYGK